MTSGIKDLKFAFWGTPQLSVDVLNILKSNGLKPTLIITAPDKKQGRGMKVAAPPVKFWAEKEEIKFLQPEKINDDFLDQLSKAKCQLFVVVAYGKILTKEILKIPEKASINLHYSLLPKLRGSSPVETAILENINPTGVTAILMNEKMDEGKILSQEKVYFENWPRPKDEIFQKLNEVGGKLLAETIVQWINGKIKGREQNEKEASYTKKIKKEDGLINLSDNPSLNYRKFLAYRLWPEIYFLNNNKRIKIAEAEFKDGKFVIKKVVPEGKKKIIYEEFLKNLS